MDNSVQEGIFTTATVLLTLLIITTTEGTTFQKCVAEHEVCKRKCHGASVRCEKKCAVLFTACLTSLRLREKKKGIDWRKKIGRQ
ncbi:hypothetical protein ScPMuIL_016127 [Solemya velum]